MINMPYIKADIRPLYDANISLELKNKDGIALQRIIELIQNSSLEEQDGIVNYVMTSFLLRFEEDASKTYPPTLSYNNLRTKIRGDRIFVKESLKKLFYEVYDPPKYFRFNRAMGVLACMSKEFERRTWSLISGSQNIIKELTDEFYKEKVGPYEDKKIEENGDLIFNPSRR